MRTEILGRALDIVETRGPVRSGALAIVEEPSPERPRTRGACVDGPRPCPWVGCRHNLYLDVRMVGSITRNFPAIDPDEMGASCALDEAEHGGMTLENVAVRMGFTRERARQLEASGLRKIRETQDGQEMRDLGRDREPVHHMSELGNP